MISFLNREPELARLNRAVRSTSGGLVVVTGRRRVGKTRLLVEWAKTHDGVYFVADESSSELHRRYFASAMAVRLAGFDEVQYPDWRALLSRLARDAKAQKFRGPVVIDELPYLVTASPELPSVLQQWLDHDAKDAKLVVALAGSSQRMMQGLVLDQSAPLFGRAKESFRVAPIDPEYLPKAFPKFSAQELLNAFTAWGGIPRYWELAAQHGGTVAEAIDDLVLDPQGPLHDEPSRLLLEELPPVTEVRPLLDAIGAGAHRVSEIASRIGRPATSLSRALERLQEMGIVRREVPFGEHERDGKKSLYVLDDPFFRLWFRIVPPNRGMLELARPKARAELLARDWGHLRAQAWEQLCRIRLPSLDEWKPGSRWWKGNEPEWDLVAESTDERTLLLAEMRAHEKPLTAKSLENEARRLTTKLAPRLPSRYETHHVTRAFFVPDSTTDKANGIQIFTLADLGVRGHK